MKDQGRPYEFDKFMNDIVKREDAAKRVREGANEEKLAPKSPWIKWNREHTEHPAQRTKYGVK